MEQEFDTLKQNVNSIFEKAALIILSQDNLNKKQTEMTLKIIQATVMRFIKTILFQKKNIILCTSTDEILSHVRVGLFRFISEDDTTNRVIIKKDIEKLKIILEKVNKYNTYQEAI